MEDNMGKISLLDCTLRDGAYIVDSRFGTNTIKGIIKKMQDAKVEIIECGWLKDKQHEEGTTFYHVPDDLKQYMSGKNEHSTYVVMIDWDRYDLNNLPIYDGKTIDAIRVVFPKKKFHEGIAVGRKIKEKGYKVYYQAANTLGYSDEELVELACEINKSKPVALSVVDTFGAMYSEDLAHIISILDKHLDEDIGLGFHSHNNQQLSFALSMQFVETLKKEKRNIIVDASLCGMGRGAGNTTTELIAGYLNRKCQGNYDMNVIMDAIDMYMGYFQTHYTWGYSTPYFISGMYCTHVNNIAYLLNNHRTNAKDMRNIIESLPPEDRTAYDYDLLEQKFIEHQNKIVDDEQAIADLKSTFYKRKILLLFPGKTLVRERDRIDKYIAENNPVVIGINAIISDFNYDYLFFSNKVRYEYAAEIYTDIFLAAKKIITSNIRTTPAENEFIINFNLLVKRGWKHFDNSGIMCLRLLNRLQVENVAMAGFDGFEDVRDESYADTSLPDIDPGESWADLNAEIDDMFRDLRETTSNYMEITFVTSSKYNGGINR